MTARLEVIRRKPERQIFPVPLLFVHGANGGAWLWDEHFLSFFARHGYDACALSLRGHGTSSGCSTLHRTGLADYVTDVNEVIRQLGGTVVLIGHSMGATIVLKCLQKQRVSAAVLMAPVPVNGLLEASFLLAWHNPALFWDMSLVQSLGPGASSHATVQRTLFSNIMSDDMIHAYFTFGWQTESLRAIVDMMGVDLPRVDCIATTYTAMPLLVCGADQDALFPQRLVQETAQRFGITAKFFPMGHAMMLETNWKEPAIYIHQWLYSLVLPDPATNIANNNTSHRINREVEQL